MTDKWHKWRGNDMVVRKEIVFGGAGIIGLIYYNIFAGLYLV